MRHRSDESMVLEGGVGLFGVLIVGHLIDSYNDRSDRSDQTAGLWYVCGTRALGRPKNEEERETHSS